jgi:CHAT domain-containing protein/tetratricopeptide (TPR) repeat protein
MDLEDLVAHLLALPDKDTRRQALHKHLPSLNSPQIESIVQMLRDAHRQYQFSDAQLSLQTVELISDIGICLHDDAILALGYRLTANAYTISFGQYEKARLLYDRAEEIFTATNDELELARMQIVRIWALSFTHGYAEAVRWGEYAYQVLERYGDVRSLSLLVNNLAVVHNRFGALDASLRLLNAAYDTLQRLGKLGRQYLANTIANHVFVLGLLGQYSAAIEMAREGLALAEHLEQHDVCARIQHNLGLTYYILGHYNRALHLFDQAQAARLADGRYHRYVQGELTATFCLLRLRRFSEVIERCQRVRQLCREHGVIPETPFSLLNEAKAYAGLGQFEEALSSLVQTREWMTTQGEGGMLNAAEADLAKAELLYRQREWSEARTIALTCVEVFGEMKRLLEVAQAYLVAARAATAMQDVEAGRDFARASLAISEPRGISALIYEGHAVLGQVAELDEEHAAAFEHYERAITALKRIQGRVMFEFRPDFMADRDKERVYEAIVGLCLSSNKPQAALEYVEEAKSRALIDLIAHRLDLRIEARTPGDEALVSELNRLNAHRNALCRQMLGEQSMTSEIVTRQQDIERRITELRNKLLVRNAEYARDLSFVEVQVEPVQPYLANDTLLIEFYSTKDGLLAFCATAQSPLVQVYRLPGKFSQVKRWQQRLQANFKTVPHSAIPHIPYLIRDVQVTLQLLYQNLLAPMAKQLAACRRLIIVPHGSLHYVPFHALFDGEKYLIETHEVSYLPASSFLCCSHDVACTTGHGMLAVGYSYQDRLPHAVAEARSLSERWQAELVCEDEATCERVQTLMAGRRIIHLATHGEFRHDNPLFSGLALADGWLTTLDVFNLRLSASLVTLSGCHTGRSLVGGGDELLGLMRAFLAAGAVSLVISQWATEDRAAAFLMERFYEQLDTGKSKSAALQEAQLGLLYEGVRSGEPVDRRHPFFWAPFYLVGDGGRL